MIVGTSLFVYVSFLRSENQERKLEKAKVSDNSNEERDQKERTNELHRICFRWKTQDIYVDISYRKNLSVT